MTSEHKSPVREVWFGFLLVGGVLGGLFDRPAKVDVVLFAVEAPAHAHLAQVEVAVAVGALPPLAALVEVEVGLPRLAARLEVDRAVALPLPVLLLVVGVFAIFALLGRRRFVALRLMNAGTCRNFVCRVLKLLEHVRVHISHEHVLAEQERAPGLTAALGALLLHVCHDGCRLGHRCRRRVLARHGLSSAHRSHLCLLLLWLVPK